MTTSTKTNSPRTSKPTSRKNAAVVTAPTQEGVAEAVTALGTSIYAKLALILEPQTMGKIVVIDVDSEDYAVSTSALDASRQLKERRPNGRFFATRVGSTVLGRFRMGRSTLD